MEGGVGDVSLMLWAITSYFNPAGYSSRLANYRTFRKFLRAPLVAVEMSFTGSFDLGPGDADVLVQLTGGDVLWQKERLLNVALGHLPGDCDAVAWLDCDIIFAVDNWPRRALTALGDLPLIQPFSERCNLARGATCDAWGWAPIDGRTDGIGSAVAKGELKPDDLRISGASFRFGAPTTGLAWVARRDLLDRHGLYDARIIGGGDRLIICAALGKFDCGVEAQSLNPDEERHYRAWGEPFFADVCGRVGFIAGRVFHLWHGDLADRQYERRQREIAARGFDQFSDIAVDANGCWRWPTHKPELHQYLKSYFASRNEDSPAPQSAASPDIEVSRSPS